MRMESILKPRPVVHSDYANVPGSRARHRTGAVLSSIAILFLLVVSVGKVIRIPAAVEGTVQLGYSESSVRVIGVILLLCLILYVVPRTSVLGAILLTAYLGGVVATRLRLGNPLFSSTLLPVYVGLLVWGGLLLREDRLRALIPLRR
jgi:DoxX-like family